ncbi:Disease resistance protein [Quillaja saponaria]|uniref:Disease resistance protein n=1 Tax=Quillaja saponaria TaxID=32244 RepID=A0AAD7P778_QUISA|nr:Disease resistance protein [Quillaja saponaria]
MKDLKVAAPKRKVYGFDHDLTLLEKLLLQPESHNGLKAIGIVGKPGVGKSTLCQELLSRPKVKAHFLPRILVSMSIKYNEDDQDLKNTIVKGMLTYLGVEEEIAKSNIINEELRGLLYALHLQLMGKRYLIVLDDVKETDAWHEKLDSSSSTKNEKWGERFAYGFPKGYGGAVIVTSTSEEIVKKMIGDKKHIHQLLPFSDQENCWSIFKDAVVDKKRIEHNPDLKKQLLDKSGGIPLAAKKIGQIVNEKLRKAEEKPPEIESGDVENKL